MDMEFMGLVGAVVGWVDERFGRGAAWLAAIVGVVAMIAVPLAIILYLLR
ncbi:hypothetical protein QH494_27330 [Sphingomonas sp. AR_OL41]|nr:hypothetical protein [Sphingomonas sp. AR_OL41]MDH7975909.1 hypothetical protein [Sphingomonas sp. AR_OL41]